ncbi:histamine H2 receptor-like [Oculina patagonica]
MENSIREEEKILGNTLAEGKYTTMNLTAPLTKVGFNDCLTVITPFWERSANLFYAVDIVLVFTTTALLITLPFTIFMNALVMAAVKSTRRLRTKPNILLVCLAATDFMVGLTVQPLFITMKIYFLRGITVDQFCTLEKVSGKMFDILCGVSLFHLVLISLERYLAIRHTFFYGNHITTLRLAIASATTWLIVLILTILEFYDVHVQFPVIAIGIDDFLIISSIPIIITLHIVVYIEVRRHEHQIISQQVSLIAKLNFLKEKKALKTTSFIILAVFICYFPSIILVATPLLPLLEDKMGGELAYIVFSFVITLTLLNSVINPLIYAARNKQFRVAFLQLLFRKRLKQAEEIEMRVVRPVSV